MRDEIIMQVTPKQATFLEKETAFSVNKNGYVVFDFSPVDSVTKNLKPEARKSFILTIKNIGEILDLNVSDPYNSSKDEEGTYM